MAAGTPVVASDLHAFRRVLRDGDAGRLVPVEDSAALAAAPDRGAGGRRLANRYIAAGTEAVRRYDWSVVANQIMRVYETVAAAGAKVQVAELMTWTIVLVVALALLVAVLLGFAAWGYQTANRLDRLHVRYDLSWQAVDGALARRAVVARAVAASSSAEPAWRCWPTPPNARPGRLARHAKTSCRLRWRWSIRRRCRRG